MALTKNNSFILFLSAVLLILISVFLFKQGGKIENSPLTNSKNVEVKKDVAYGKEKAQKLDICNPKSLEGNAPGVILLHGGGGDKSDLSASCQALAARGFIAISPNFREEPSPSITLSFEDITLALEWLKNRKDVNPNKIAAMGGSYGGLMASLLGTREFDNKVVCVVNNFGPTDLTNEDIQTSPLYEKAVDKYFGGVTIEQNPTLYEEFSPVHQLSEDDAPHWLLTRGVNDKLVPRSQMTVMLNALQSLGIDAEFIEYEGTGGGHANRLPKRDLEKIFYQRINFIENCLKSNPPQPNLNND